MRPTSQEHAPAQLQCDFEKVWDDWAHAEEISLPANWRRAKERAFLLTLSQSYDLNQTSHRTAVVNLFTTYAQTEVAMALLLLNSRRRRPRIPNPRPRRRGQIRKRIGKRPRDEKLLSFAADRIVPYPHLLRGDLKPGRIGVPWPDLLAKWHRLNPRPEDWYPSWQALRVAYFAAARDPHLRHAFLSALQQEIDEEWTSAAELGIGEPTKPHIASVPVSTSAPSRSPSREHALASLRQYRRPEASGESVDATLTRAQLIALHLLLDSIDEKGKAKASVVLFAEAPDAPLGYWKPLHDALAPPNEPVTTSRTSRRPR
jgi:hypothetical protein